MSWLSELIARVKRSNISDEERVENAKVIDSTDAYINESRDMVRRLRLEYGLDSEDISQYKEGS